MTALRKRDEGVRGIVAGAAFRRLVARSLARQFGEEMEAACAPFQFALSTRAGTDCVGHVIRFLTEAYPGLSVLSVDGVGAYDNIWRSAMLGKLRELPTASKILPFVRLSYSSPSEYVWVDETGTERTVRQCEGGEQGDPLMPVLFSLGLHSALERAQRVLEEGEFLFAFLDDVYVLASSARVRQVYDTLAQAILEETGVRLNEGKTRVWNAIGVQPPDLEDLGEDVWSPNGIKILGTPVGQPAFLKQSADDRLAEEEALLTAVESVPDLQSAWQILLQSANARCNHLLRTLPPSASKSYAQGHDQRKWTAVERLLGLSLSDDERSRAQRTSSLPMRLGGLGLRSAERTAPAAYWASWADALSMLQQRCPLACSVIVEELEEGPSTPCLVELRDAAALLQREGFAVMPTWAELANGARPPLRQDADAGEWSQGWQFFAASTREHFFRKWHCDFEGAGAARLRSRSGPGSAAVLGGCPTRPEYTMDASVFRTLVLDRLALPLPAVALKCEGCGAHVDREGIHYSCCTRTGRIRRRAAPTERIAARICREAGAVVKTNVLLRDMNVGVGAGDGRQLEVLAQGLPCYAGAQLAVDVTLRSSLTACGEARGRAAFEDGATCTDARRDKEAKYNELISSSRCRLVVLAMEVGGRCSGETMEFLEALSWARARSAVPLVRHATALGWRRRWLRMLACAAARAWAESVTLPADLLWSTAVDGDAPPDADVLAEDARG